MEDRAFVGGRRVGEVNGFTPVTNSTRAFDGATISRQPLVVARELPIELL